MMSTIVKREGNWLSASVGEELVMMSVATGNYVSISRVGLRIWELIERPRTVDEICARLVDEFDVAPETCRADVQKFLEEMVGNQAVALEAA